MVHQTYLVVLLSLIQFISSYCILYSVLHRAVSKKDLATAAVLIRLGADPLLVNGRQHTPAQQLSIKCFPHVSPTTNISEKGKWRNFVELWGGRGQESYDRFTSSANNHTHSSLICVQ